MHPFKKYEENRHGRAVAKARGYQGGGNVSSFPGSLRDADLQRLRSSQGIEGGRIPGTSEGNVVSGPGRHFGTGGIKRSWLTRQEEREMMPRAKGGRVKKLTGGADSGVGRMELAKRAATRHGKSK